MDFFSIWILSEGGSISKRRCTCYTAEYLGKITLVIKAHSVRNVSDAEVFIPKKTFGFFDANIVQIIIKCCAGFFFEYAAEIRWGQIDHLCKLIYIMSNQEKAIGRRKDFKNLDGIIFGMIHYFQLWLASLFQRLFFHNLSETI